MSLGTGALKVSGVSDTIAAGGIHGNPGMREPPKRAPANRHRHTENQWK